MKEKFEKNVSIKNKRATFDYELLDTYTAGIVLKKKTGDFVQKGEEIATLYANDKKLFERSKEIILNATKTGEEKPQSRPLIFATIR